MTSLVGIKQMPVETESLLQRDYIFIYIEKHHVSVENIKEHVHDDYIIFTVAQPDDCKRISSFLIFFFFLNIWAGKMDYFQLVALLIG